MRDWGAIRRFTPGAFGINMNPLTVFGRLGKLPNAVLRNEEPIGRGDFAAYEIFQRLQCFQHDGRHGFLRYAGCFGNFLSSSFATVSRCTSSGPSASRSVRTSPPPSAENG